MPEPTKKYSIASCPKTLKLRHNFKLNDNCRLEYGLDHSAKHDTHPWAGVRYQWDADRSDSMALELNTDYFAVCTEPVNLISFKGFKLPVSAKIGIKTSGHKHFELGLHNPIVSIGALVLLTVLKKPLALQRKEVGGWSLSLPTTQGSILHSVLQVKPELEATLNRTGGLLPELQFNELNAVLRIRQT